MLKPFAAAIYSKELRANISQLAIPDLDTAEHVWGHKDSTFSFRNVLVGPPEHRGELWQAWISASQIELDDEPAFYVLHQEQNLLGKKIDRWAVYAAISIHDENLFIHEDVLPEGVERARQGMEACEADMASIFVGCEESLGFRLKQILEPYSKANKPLLTFQESENSRHTVWKLSDRAVEEKLSFLFEGVPLFLLDGHHRLAAARENFRLGMGDGKIMACVCSLSTADTLILPIHRAVYSERWILPDVLTGDLIRAGCSIEEESFHSVAEALSMISPENPSCVMLHSYSNSPVILRLPAISTLPKSLGDLAVARLDFGFLSQQSQLTTIPVPNLETALEQLATDQAQAAFFLPAATAAQVRAVASARLMMPRKSTRFVPKPALGLITRPWTS